MGGGYWLGEAEEGKGVTQVQQERSDNNNNNKRRWRWRRTTRKIRKIIGGF
jgi:hypothetical protein